MYSTIIDTERQVIVHTNDYAVLRYDDDTPMHFRRHDITVGRYPDAATADDRMTQLDELEGHPSAQYLHVEERSEEWETPLECTCASLTEDSFGQTIHYEDCLLIEVLR